MNIKNLPVFEYYDTTADDEMVPLIKQAKIAKKLYNFCLKKKTNVIKVRNTFTNEEGTLKINYRAMKKFLSAFGYA